MESLLSPREKLNYMKPELFNPQLLELPKVTYRSEKTCVIQVETLNGVVHHATSPHSLFSIPADKWKDEFKKRYHFITPKLSWKLTMHDIIADLSDPLHLLGVLKGDLHIKFPLTPETRTLVDRVFYKNKSDLGEYSFKRCIQNLNHLYETRPSTFENIAKYAELFEFKWTSVCMKKIVKSSGYDFYTGGIFHPIIHSSGYRVRDTLGLTEGGIGKPGLHCGNDSYCSRFANGKDNYIKIDVYPDIQNIYGIDVTREGSADVGVCLRVSEYWL